MADGGNPVRVQQRHHLGMGGPIAEAREIDPPGIHRIAGDHIVDESHGEAHIVCGLRILQGAVPLGTDAYGDMEPRMDFQGAGFEIFLEDTRLEEPVRTPHTWFTSVPRQVKEHPERKVPLMMFFHGASDNPAEAAEMSKFHELGEREGFITVYPWGTNRTQWNSSLEDPEAVCIRVRAAHPGEKELPGIRNKLPCPSPALLLQDPSGGIPLIAVDGGASEVPSRRNPHP